MSIRTSDVMATSVVTLDPDMTLHEMDTILVKRGVSGAPVVEAGRLVGVASQTDIIRTLWEGQQEPIHPAPFYASTAPLSAIEFMARDANGVGDALVEHRVRDVMTADPLVARPGDPLEDVAERMVRDQIHRLPVVEEGTAALVGIITSLDLARAITLHGLGSVP